MISPGGYYQVFGLKNGYNLPEVPGVVSVCDVMAMGNPRAGIAVSPARWGEVAHALE